MSSSESDSVNPSAQSIHSSMATKDRKELHDQLLAQMPEGASHEPCSLCLVSDDLSEGGTHVGKTYTEEELQTAVAEATVELAAKVTAFESAAAESELTSAVAAVKAEAEGEIEELKAKLDNAVLAAQSVKAEFDDFKTGLEELVSTAEAAAEASARKDARVEEAKSFGFTDEYLGENADRFAAMSDEDWETRLADWRVVAPKGGPATDAIPSKTALTAAREDTNTNSGMATIREVMRGNLVGRDLRTL